MTGRSDALVTREEGVGLWLVLGAAGVSGVSTFVNSYAVAGTSSDAFVTVRNIVVALLIVPLVVLALRAGHDRLRTTDWLRLVTIGLVGGAVPFVLFFRGLQLATAAGGAPTASFLYRTLFLWASVLGVLALGEMPRLRLALAAGVLLIGNFLLLSLTSLVWTDGSLYVLAATGLWAAEYTISKRTLRAVPTATVALGRMGFGAVFLVGYLALSGQLGAATRFPISEWIWVGISAALLAAFVATWYAGLRRLDLGVASAVLVLGFPVTLVVSAVVRGTSTPWVPALGAVAVAVGVLLAAGPARLREAERVLWEALRRPTLSSS